MISNAAVVKSVQKLPTLPVSVTRLMKMSNDRNSGAEDFGRILKPDPALTANILKMANSAYFGCSRRVTSVSQAVAFLGVKKVVDTAVGAAFIKVIPALLPGYQVKATDFWRHCVAVAVLTERMSEALKLAMTDESFTCGLLHDIGKLVTSTYLEEKKVELSDRIKGKRCTILQAEKEILGFDHTEIGVLVADSWKLPETICTAIRWHHNPSLAPEDDRLISEVTHIADCISHAFGYGADIGELERDIDPCAMPDTGISTPELEHIVGESIAEIEELCVLFQGNSGG